jgi:23S rRNA (adenine-N6)-dimethyltransferase
MAGKTRKDIAWAQNFLIRQKLARKLVDESSIGAQDAVYEIGAGRGILTAELARIARKVIALEIDPALTHDLRGRFQGVPNVEIRTVDFLESRIDEKEYKIFANIPFNRTAEIVRKILDSVPAPRDAYLVMQKEAAEKFCGRPKETRFAILAKPWFQMQIIRELHRTDFEPVPGVDSVLLRIQKRNPAFLPDDDAALYRRFVAYGFGGWKRSLKITFRRIFSYRQWKLLAQNLRFPMHATPSELTIEQWVGLFAGFKQRVPYHKQTAVRGRKPSIFGAQMDF